jgi:uncharacterized membrane-anchored protein
MPSATLPHTTSLPPDHAQRKILADEVHARPPEAVETPSRVTYIAILIDAAERDREHAHLVQLCQSLTLAAPDAAANHFSADLGQVRLKWERHGEFSDYMFTSHGRGTAPFSEPPIDRLPSAWFAAVPGRTLFAANGELIPTGEATPDAEFLSAYFGGNVVIGAEIGGGAGLAYTDFMIDGAGFERFLVLNGSLTSRQAGRMLQRLFEIECYRMMAMLALPIARQQAPHIAAMESALASLTEEMTQPGADDDALLQQLTRLAAAVQSVVAATQFRFNACRAYQTLVKTRIGELRESRLPGIQPVEEFMQRRFTPAAATCASLARRLKGLSERVTQASSLLSTRVDIVRERQNQQLLATMNRRAELQFRLQRTVEGLSVVAIVYYMTGLVGYIAKALKALQLRVDPELAEGAAIPLLIVLCLWVLSRARRHLHA